MISNYEVIMVIPRLKSKVATHIFQQKRLGVSLWVTLLLKEFQSSRLVSTLSKRFPNGNPGGIPKG